METVEEQDAPSTSNEAVVFLMLGENKFPVEKKNLMKKSNYFNALMSHNFRDSHDKVFPINYRIDPAIFHVFIEWVQYNDVVLDKKLGVKTCMKKYLSNHYDELVSLLRLSVLFVADELTNEIVDIIILHWLIPDLLIEQWLLGEELFLRLKDIAFSMCKERFMELPTISLVTMPEEKFLTLLKSYGVNCRKSYFNFIINERRIVNPGESPVLSDVVEKIFKKEIEDNRFLICVGGYKTDESSQKRVCIYCWDGNDVYELTELTWLPVFTQNYVGMQIVKRGLNIYVVGGEAGYGTGKFNMEIWRYCLISRKWYYVTRLLEPRRHMVTVFLGHYLVLVGGVGRYRQKVVTVHMYHIYKGSWSKGQSVPDLEGFTEIPPHCVINHSLLLFRTFMWEYLVHRKYWRRIMCGLEKERSEDVDFLARTSTGKYHIRDDYTECFCCGKRPRKTLPDDTTECHEGSELPSADCRHISHFSKSHLDVSCVSVDVETPEHALWPFPKNSAILNDRIITFFSDATTIQVRQTNELQFRYRKECTKVFSKEKTKDLQSATFNVKLGCFRILNPKFLYDSYC